MRVGQSNTAFGAREFVSQRLNNQHLGQQLVTKNANKPRVKVPSDLPFDLHTIKQNGKWIVSKIFKNQDA